MKSYLLFPPIAIWFVVSLSTFPVINEVINIFETYFIYIPFLDGPAKCNSAPDIEPGKLFSCNKDLLVNDLFSNYFIY